MKKPIALLLVLSTLFSLVACGVKQDDPAVNSATSTTPSTAPTSEPTTSPTYAISYDKAFNDILNSLGTPESSEISLDIPVYDELELLVRSYGGMFDLSRDAYYYNHLSGRMPNYALTIFDRYPTNAIRVRADGSSYAVWDTDTGYRFYLFFQSKSPRTIGFPVLIKKNNILSYSDFKDIQIGDPIEKVEAIDDVATLHKRRMTGFAPAQVDTFAKYGYPPSSIHYLKDGILKIEYICPEMGTLIISNILFDENFAIKTANGTADREMTSHKIKDIDLPVT